MQVDQLNRTVLHYAASRGDASLLARLQAFDPTTTQGGGGGGGDGNAVGLGHRPCESILEVCNGKRTHQHTHESNIFLYFLNEAFQAVQLPVEGQGSLSAGTEFIFVII
jgi:hypothetical protein